MICAPLVPLLLSMQYSSSFHVYHKCDSLTLACEICSQNSWRGFSIRGWCMPSKVWPSRWPRNGSFSSCPSLLVPYALEAPFTVIVMEHYLQVTWYNHCCQQKLKRVSLLFYSCSMFVSVTFLSRRLNFSSLRSRYFNRYLNHIPLPPKKLKGLFWTVIPKVGEHFI